MHVLLFLRGCPVANSKLLGHNLLGDSRERVGRSPLHCQVSGRSIHFDACATCHLRCECDILPSVHHKAFDESNCSGDGDEWSVPLSSSPWRALFVPTEAGSPLSWRDRHSTRHIPITMS